MNEDRAIEFCEVEHHHGEKVKRVVEQMPNDELMFGVAELFKVFGDSTRTRILSALFVSEMCVCDLADVLGMTKSAVSHQLRVLRQTKIVKARRNGKEVYYSLADSHIEEIYKMAIEHLTEEK